MSDKESGIHVGHFPCPSCASSDNLSVYLKTDENGADYYDGSCWTPGCEHKFWTNNELVEAGVLSGEFTVDKAKLKEPRKPITKQEYEELCNRTNFSGKMKDGTQYRGLADWVLKFYGHRVERNSDGSIKAVYYPETKDNKPMGFKSRYLPKIFGKGNIGKTGITNDLSGMHKFPNGGKYVVIVGGEEDKCAAQQMFRDYQIKRNQEDYDHYAVVSPTTGEGGAAKQCAANYDWLDTFDNIVVCMDNDKAGIEAIEELVKVLPKDKVKVMKTSGKDANQMLLDGRQKQFISNFWDAKEVVHSGIFNSVEASQGIREYLTAPKIPFPPSLRKLNEASRGGIRSTGAIINIIADTSTGKTMFSDTLSIWWTYNSPLVPTTLSIERTKEEYMIDLISQHLGKNLTWFKDGMQAVEYLDNPEVSAIVDDFLTNEHGEPRFHVIDERTGKIDALKMQIEKSWKSRGSRLFILDPLTDILQHLPPDEQESFFLWEKQMKKEGLVLVNIIHTRKPLPDKDGKIRFVTEYDAKGTGSSVQSADINIVLNRDKMAVDPIVRNTTRVDVPKLRGGTTGHVCDLYYDSETRKQYDKEDYSSMIKSPVDIKEGDIDTPEF